MKLVSAAEAAEAVRSGDRVYVQCAAAAPSVLLDALSCVPSSCATWRSSTSTSRAGPHWPRRWPATSATRPLHRPERPRRRQRGPGRLRARLPVGRATPLRCGLLPLDVVLCNVSMPDEHGYCSLGTAVEAMQAAIRSAKTVIVQLNAAMPRTLGESFVHVSQIDYAVEVEVRPTSCRPARSTPWRPDRRVRRGDGPDGATLQMGIGAIPNAVALFLRDKHDLGIHTELMTDPVVDSWRRCRDGAGKERNRGKIVATFMMGTEKLYRFAHDNPMLEMRACDFTNDTHVIRSFRRMTAINSAIAID